MGDLLALAAIWPTLAAGTTSQKLVALNAKTIPGPPQDINVSVLQTYITNNHLQTPIATYAQRGANITIPLTAVRHGGNTKSALIACNYLIALLNATDPIIHASIPENYAAIKTLGIGLVSDPATGVTPALLAGMLALIVPPATWWSMNGFTGEITITELIAAGYLF